MPINPLKILTFLTASKAARFEETVNISGAVTAQNGVTVSGGSLSVSAGNISGSGTLQAGGAATLASGATLTGGNLAVNSGNISGSGTLQAGGAATLANGVTVTGAAVNASAVAVSASALNVTNAATIGGGATLTGGNLAVNAGNISGSGTLQAGGAATLANGVTVTGAALNASAVAVSASSLNVANTASVGGLTTVGDATIGGNLTVRGTITSIDSTTVNIGDLNLALGTGSATLAGVNGGGIDLGQGALVQWRYDNTNSAWTSNVSFNAQTDSQAYKISGSTVLSKSGTVLQVGSGMGQVMVGNSTTAAISGALQLSGATNFSYITSVTRNGGGLYNVDAAIQALDIAVSGAVTSSSGGTTAIKNSYNALRVIRTGSLDVTGQATIDLTALGGATNFSIAQSASIALDVMVDTNNNGQLTNDLVAVRFLTSGSNLQVQIDGPASPSVPYRLIAVNEKAGGLG